MLDPNLYVRVTQYTNATIVGRYGGVNYEFPDSHEGEYLDVEKVVALHCFGYGGTEAQKEAAIMRLGWTTRMTMDEAKKQLLECIVYRDVPPFPASIAEFRRPRAENQTSGVPHAPESDREGSGPSASAASGQPFSPYGPKDKKQGGRR